MSKIAKNSLRLVLVFLFSALLLTNIPRSIVQADPETTNYWDAAHNIGDEADVFFDDSYIHEIRLYFDDPNWYNVLFYAHDNDRSTPDAYFPARFVSHGIEINPVGARFKGYSTFGLSTDDDVYANTKKPFRLDFNIYDPEDTEEETTFFGLKKLNLNNCGRDPSLVREKLFMDFASKYVPAPRCVYTRLYINDQYYGLYLAVEHIDNTFVENRFGPDESGNLYKAEMYASLHYLGPTQALYYHCFELKNNEETNNWSDLVELTDVLTNTPISELPQELEPIFDVESAMYSMALLDLFVSLDSYIGYVHNYYLYDRTDTGQLTYLLWDANLAFGGFWFTLTYGMDKAKYPLFPPSILDGYGLAMHSIESRTLVIVKNAMAVESYKRIYLRAIAQMLREGFDTNSFNTRIQELTDLIRDDVYSDPHLMTDLEDFEPELDWLTNFVENRVAYISPQLDAYAQKSDLRLNDLMTATQEIIADNMGDYDPWVELYNIGPATVNTSQVFLTDDSAVPNKWEIPTQSLDDSKCMLLWLDGEPNEGAYHAPFSITSGDNLYLFMYNSSDYVLVDSVAVPELDADASFGRFPNGDGFWYSLNDPATPAQPNKFDGVPDGLVINEFMANNDDTVAGPYGDYPDWIELYNGGTVTINVSNLYLTDDLSNTDKWRFPKSAVIEPNGYLIVWADNSSEKETMHTCFSLNTNGEAVGLFSFDGKTVIDSVVFGQQINDISYARPPDGYSVWSLFTPTFCASNEAGKRVVIDNMYINEFMADNDGAVAGPFADYPDWIEIYNGGNVSIDVGGMYLTDELNNTNLWRFPEGSIIDAGGFLVVWTDNSSNRGTLHTNFGLNKTGEAIGLVAADGQTIVDSVVFGEQFTDTSYARTSDGGSSWDYFTSSFRRSNKYGDLVCLPDDVFGNLLINEFMASNDGAVAGPDGEYSDWIEIYNKGNRSINLADMFLTDDLNRPNGWRFPDNTFIEAGGFLVVWADNAPEKGGLHASFSLNSDGESVGLYASNAETLLDWATFGEQFDDVSYARVSDGLPSWDYFTPTCNLPNDWGTSVPEPSERIGILFVNEFMANNYDMVAGPNGGYPDWIELYNDGNESVNLGGMYLTDNLSSPTKWRFPKNTIIEPYGFVVVWADNSSETGTSHTSFAINASGEAVGLFGIDGKTLIDSVVFGEQFGDISYARLSDGGSDWDYFTPTNNQSNALGNPIPKSVDLPHNLVINELMADNDGAVTGPNDDYPDWIELYNGGNETVNLGGMYLTDNLDHPNAWRFPDNTFIEAGGFMVIWADNASSSDGLHADFNLNANGELIALFAPDGMTIIDSVVFTRQSGDVSYARLPDGNSNWTHLLLPTPGWQNNKRNYDFTSSLWPILLLVTLIGAVSVLCVAIPLLNEKHKRFNV